MNPNKSIYFISDMIVSSLEIWFGPSSLLPWLLYILMLPSLIFNLGSVVITDVLISLSINFIPHVFLFFYFLVLTLPLGCFLMHMCWRLNGKLLQISSFHFKSLPSVTSVLSSICPCMCWPLWPPQVETNDST